MISHPAKLATPLVAASVLPPAQARVAPVPGCVVMASETELVAVVTVLPPTSWTVTTGWVPQARPSVPPPGSVVKASWEAPPTVMAKGLVVTAVNPLAAADSV